LLPQSELDLLTATKQGGQKTTLTKNQIQALDRTQPGLLMKEGRGATTTHGYKPQRRNTLVRGLERRLWRGLRPVPGETPPPGISLPSV
jgi:hypothetical protein